ncbi:MAG TPA: hypothetical protein VGA49_01035 [Patescibacteria group bacterium]
MEPTEKADNAPRINLGFKVLPFVVGLIVTFIVAGLGTLALKHYWPEVYSDQKENPAEKTAADATPIIQLVEQPEKTSWLEIKKVINRKFHDSDFQSVEITWQENQAVEHLSVILRGSRVELNLHLLETPPVVYDVRSVLGLPQDALRLWAGRKLQSLIDQNMFDDFPREDIKRLVLFRISLLTTKKF